MDTYTIIYYFKGSNISQKYLIIFIKCRPPNEKDCHEYEEVQKVLREEIVNPLRKNIYVSADRVMKLRTLLEKLSSVSGLTSEEKGSRLKIILINFITLEQC